MPLEKDVVRAKLHLEDMKSSLGELSGSVKGSVVEKLKSMERWVDFYQCYV